MCARSACLQGEKCFVDVHTAAKKTDHAPFAPVGAKPYKVFETLKNALEITFRCIFIH